MRRRAASLAIVTAGLAGCGPKSSPAPSATDPAVKAALSELPAAYQGADLANGKLRFGQCRSCHTIAPGGANMTGPALHGVFGRRVGSAPGFNYSAALRKANFTWDAAHLDPWLKKPRDYLPGTRMSFAGLADDKDRRDLIAYLKVASTTPQP